MPVNGPATYSAGPLPSSNDSMAGRREGRVVGRERRQERDPRKALQLRDAARLPGEWSASCTRAHTTQLRSRRRATASASTDPVIGGADEVHPPLQCARRGSRRFRRCWRTTADVYRGSRSVIQEREGADRAVGVAERLPPRSDSARDEPSRTVVSRGEELRAGAEVDRHEERDHATRHQARHRALCGPRDSVPGGDAVRRDAACRVEGACQQTNAAQNRRRVRRARSRSDC